MKKVFVQLESGRGYGRDLLKGIYDYTHQFPGWEIVFEPVYYLNKENKNMLSLIKMLKPDGCIIEHFDRMEEVASLNIPIIQTNWTEHLESNPCLKGNYEADGLMAFEYFHNLGFRSLAFFGIDNLEWSKARLNSFARCCALQGIEVFEYQLKISKRNTLTSDFKSLINWVISLPKPIGILCCNDDFGQMLINACSMGKIKVPGEVAILGIDNDELLCNLTSPGLSSISRNHTQAAFKACEMLDKMMKKEKIELNMIPTQPLQIVVRGSTDTIACNDEEVVKAMYYIRNNIHLPLNVEDVVNITNISRRSLYNRFKNVTGRTINEEIQFYKLKKFKELIKNKNLSVKEAAYSLGFNDVSHVSRWFASIEGLAPIKWKKGNLK